MMRRVAQCGTQDLVAEAVRVRLKDLGVRHREFATAVGLSPSGLSLRLSGHVCMTVDDVALFAEVLGLDPHDLVAGRANPLGVHAS